MAVELDAESAEWVRCIRSTGAEYEAGLRKLHTLLLKVAYRELNRRHTRIAGPELDDLVHQVADDALVAILSKIEGFRGESRFTTWAYAFVMFETSAKLGRHFWRDAPVSLDAETWERLPDRFGLDPAQAADWGDLMAGVRKAVDETLTEHQRQVFVALVLNEVPLDALVERLNLNRNAVYKVMFDARRKIRVYLVANSYLTDESRRS